MKGAYYIILKYPGRELPAIYRNLVFSKWLRSLRFGNDYFKLIESAAYYASYHRYIDSVISRPNTDIYLAVLGDDVDVVLGFSIVQGDALHYVHVHKDQRKQGIGGSLVPKEIKTITHLTKMGMSIWASKMPKAIFNPFL